MQIFVRRIEAGGIAELGNVVEESGTDLWRYPRIGIENESDITRSQRHASQTCMHSARSIDL